MPRFFFDVLENGVRSADRYGVELEALDEVSDQAVSILPDLARDVLPNGERHAFGCEVRNEAGRVVYRATLTLEAGRVDEPAPL